MIENNINNLIEQYSLSEEEIIQITLGTMCRCMICDSIKPINASSNWCKECFETFVGMEHY